MNKHAMTKEWIWALLPVVAACGGGGGSDGGSGAGSAPPPAAQAPEPDPAVTSTKDLIAPEGFDYNPIETRRLTVDISSVSTQRAYLSVYRSYSVTDNGETVPDYGTRIIAVSLNKGKSELELNISDSEEELLAEVWFYDGSAPLQKRFFTSSDNWVW